MSNDNFCTTFEDYPQEVQFSQQVTEKLREKLGTNRKPIQTQIIHAIQQLSVALEFPTISKREINEAIDFLKTAVSLIED